MSNDHTMNALLDAARMGDHAAVNPLLDRLTELGEEELADAVRQVMAAQAARYVALMLTERAGRPAFALERQPGEPAEAFSNRAGWVMDNALASLVVTGQDAATLVRAAHAWRRNNHCDDPRPVTPEVDAAFFAGAEAFAGLGVLAAEPTPFPRALLTVLAEVMVQSRHPCPFINPIHQVMPAGWATDPEDDGLGDTD